MVVHGCILSLADRETCGIHSCGWLRHIDVPIQDGDQLGMHGPAPKNSAVHAEKRPQLYVIRTSHHDLCGTDAKYLDGCWAASK